MNEYLVGLLLAVAIAALAAVTGLDRGRAFYPTALIVIASYYALFAAMGASMQTLLLECIPIAVFVALALVGFKKSTWLVAAGIAGHGLFDFVHHWFIQNPGMPLWWPGFCGSVDVALGAWLAFRLARGAGPTAP